MARPSRDDDPLTDSASSLLSPTSHPRRPRRTKTATRTIAFIASILSALCAGSITTFSLYGHIFQERLRYTQLQVNGVAIGSSVAQYLPVPFLGFICDRFGTKPLSALAAVLFGLGYGLAAAIYRSRDVRNAALGPEGGDWTYPFMVFAFFCVGVGTCSMYLTAVATCAKNFGKGRNRGLALAAPIASFGLSGMWISQVGSRLFYETRPDGTRGDVDVFLFFVALAVLLVVVGTLGTATLRVVDEDDLIDEAIEELENSGLLEGGPRGGRGRGYGAVDVGGEDEETSLLGPEDARLKKNWVLNAETRRFLSDVTMWPFALGFLLMIGPGEAFINNMGTVIGTLRAPGAGAATSAATHVSIVGITSTVARLLTGSLTDLLAPSPQTQHVQVTAGQPAHRRFSVSRVTFLLTFGAVLSLGLLFLASGLVQDHGERFWVVSSLVGAGYGAVFSLTPIIIAVIWGVENFATNWGIVAMFPAVGASFWGVVYSAVYQAGAEKARGTGDGDIFCYGHGCYAPTFWAMTGSVWVACMLVLWAWRGAHGWVARGVVV